MLESLTNILESLNRFLSEREKLQKMEEGLAESHQLMALVKEAEASPDGQHPLYKLSERYFALQQAQNMMIGATMSLRQKVEDCDSRLSQYDMAIHFLGNSQIRILIDKEESKSIQVFNNLMLDDVKEFLQNAGQPTLIEQVIFNIFISLYINNFFYFIYIYYKFNLFSFYSVQNQTMI